MYYVEFSDVYVDDVVLFYSYSISTTLPPQIIEMYKLKVDGQRLEMSLSRDKKKLLPLLNKHYLNRGNLSGDNIPLKCCYIFEQCFYIFQYKYNTP